MATTVLTPGKKLTAHAIITRNGDTYWRPVGVAFVNSDLSLNVILDALPVGGRLNIRDTSEEPKAAPSGEVPGAGTRLNVFSIREGKDDSFWTRIGAAWVNKDGSLNVVLELMPLDGKAHIRKPSEKKPEAVPPQQAASEEAPRDVQQQQAAREEVPREEAQQQPKTQQKKHRQRQSAVPAAT